MDTLTTTPTADHDLIGDARACDYMLTVLWQSEYVNSVMTVFYSRKATAIASAKESAASVQVHLATVIDISTGERVFEG